MEERMIFAGTGGQGIMLMGKLLAMAVMNEGRNVTWFPSYGAEVRGGTAHCHVVIADGEVYSPLVERAGTLVVMNEQSLGRFRKRLEKGGFLAVNTSMAAAPEDADGPVLSVRATDIANELGNIRIANMVMLAAVNARKRLVTDDSLWAAVEEYAGKERAHLLDINRKAFEKGLDAARSAARRYPSPQGIVAKGWDS